MDARQWNDLYFRRIGEFDCLRPRYHHSFGFSSKDYSYVRIWGRIRDDWGAVEPNTFELELEQAHQHDERTTSIDELRKHIKIPERPKAYRRY
jgi:hypothetical protein